MQLATKRIWELTDIPQISLGLLNSIFKSDFSHEKSYMQWKSRQVMITFEFFSLNPLCNKIYLGNNHVLLFGIKTWTPLILVNQLDTPYTCCSLELIH